MDVPSTKKPILLPMPAFAVKRGVAEATAIPDAAVVLYEHVADDCLTATVIVLGYYYECPRIVLACNDAAHALEWDWETETWQSIMDKWATTADVLLNSSERGDNDEQPDPVEVTL